MIVISRCDQSSSASSSSSSHSSFNGSLCLNNAELQALLLNLVLASCCWLADPSLSLSLSFSHHPFCRFVFGRSWPPAFSRFLCITVWGRRSQWVSRRTGISRSCVKTTDTHISADDTASNEAMKRLLLCCSCESASVSLSRAAVSVRMFHHDTSVEVNRCCWDVEPVC